MQNSPFEIFDDSECEIDYELCVEPKERMCTRYINFTHQSKLVMDKGKVSSMSLNVFVQALKAMAKYNKIKKDESPISSNESPKINHFNFNTSSAYENPRLKRNGKSSF